jgi:hypothetical protein
MKSVYVAAISLLALTACDGMNTGGGSTQEIKIVTVPSQANCAVDVNNVTVDRFNGTPLTAKVASGSTVRCIKSGYKQGSAVVKSGEKTVNITLARK